MGKFKFCDHMKWNSEAGWVSGTITKVHVKDFTFKGHARHVSPTEPQYAIDSDRTDHVAAHTENALTKA